MQSEEQKEQSSFASWVTELGRRHVFRVLAIYVAVGWGFTEIVQGVVEQVGPVSTVFRDGELLYGNMVRDLYYLGKVLDKKYRYLTMSYNIFMIGFIATVITFLIAMFG